MSSEQLFANGRIAVLSTRLLNKDKYLRIAESGTLAEALKILSEYGYGTVADVSLYEQVLREEMDKTLEEVKELCLSANAMKYLLCVFDYHNAKVLMKGKYMREDFCEYCFVNASYIPEQMRQDFALDDYHAYTVRMAEACDEIDMQFAEGHRSPQIIDRLLDKAYFADLRRYATRSFSKLLMKLYELTADFANITLAKRLHSAGGDPEQASLWFVDGGSVGKDVIMQLCTDGDTSRLMPEYRRLCDCDSAETVFSAMRKQIIEEYADPLTIQPAIQYFFAKQSETELLRCILVEVKNCNDKDKIKEKINAHA